MWGTNIDVFKYILNPYAVTSYCTSYLTKTKTSLSQEMKIILDKCKHEQIKAFEHIKKLGNAFKCTTNVYTTSCVFNIIHTIIPFKISFQFINTCQQQDRTFVLLPQKKYKAYLEALQKSL